MPSDRLFGRHRIGKTWRKKGVAYRDIQSFGKIHAFLFHSRRQHADADVGKPVVQWKNPEIPRCHRRDVMQLDAIGESSDVPVVAAYCDQPVRRIDRVAAYLARYGRAIAVGADHDARAEFASKPGGAVVADNAANLLVLPNKILHRETFHARRRRGSRTVEQELVEHSPSNHASKHHISLARVIEIDFGLNMLCAAKQDLAKTNTGKIDNCVCELQIAQDGDRLTRNRVSTDLVAWKAALIE